MNAANALSEKKYKWEDVTNKTSEVTNKILTGFGFQEWSYERLHNRLYPLFHKGSMYDDVNEITGLCRVVLQTSNGITLYMPNLDTTILSAPDFEHYLEPSYASSLYIKEPNTEALIEKVYESIPADSRGLYLGACRRGESMSRNARRFLEAMESQIPKEFGVYDDLTNSVAVYRYGDFYHFATGDCVNPLTHLLGVYYAYVAINSYDL